MSSIHTTLTLFSPLFALLVVVANLLSRKAASNYKSLDEVKQFLHPKDSSLDDLLRERALSNARLIRALRLSNTFVNPCFNIHKVFVRDARRLLTRANSSGRGWPYLRQLAVDATSWHLANTTLTISPFPFAVTIQNISLVVVLGGVLNVSDDLPSFDHEDVTFVAQHINTLWAMSKKSTNIPDALRDELNFRLRRLIPDKDRFPNPLDFVIPTWETFWRVVAITVAYAHNQPELLEALQALHEDPRNDTFRFVNPDTSISAQAIISEVMRLHPPSKRIGRTKARSWIPAKIAAFLRPWLPNLIDVKGTADIELLLVDEDIWGAGAKQFDPARHHARNKDHRTKECMDLIFGHGPTQCIAATWAPMAAAVVSAAILETLADQGHNIRAGADIGGRESWGGWSIE